MANNYILFSFDLPELTEPERAWLDRLLVNHDDLSEEECNAWEAEFGSPFDEWPDFSFQFLADQSLWIHSEDCGSVNNAIQATELFLKKFRPDQERKVSWAETCSSSRLDEFGGGSYVCNPQPRSKVRLLRQARELVQEANVALVLDAIDTAIKEENNENDTV